MNLVNLPLTMNALLALWAMRTSDGESVSQAILRVAVQVQPPKAKPIASKPLTGGGKGKFSYEIFSEKRQARFAVDAYIDILTTLSKCEPSLPHSLSIVAPSTSRKHIAQTKAEIYPSRPDLGQNAREFYPGWFAGINIADREKERILRLACNLLRIKFGKDIVFGSMDF